MQERRMINREDESVDNDKLLLDRESICDAVFFCTLHILPHNAHNFLHVSQIDVLPVQKATPMILNKSPYSLLSLRVYVHIWKTLFFSTILYI